MGSLVHTTWLAQVLKQLPAPLVRALDAWSEGVARRKSQQRRRSWEARKTAKARAARPPAPYRPQPWRD
jgi:hypothetical protein